jgi:hypothetical protein
MPEVPFDRLLISLVRWGCIVNRPGLALIADFFGFLIGSAVQFPKRPASRVAYPFQRETNPVRRFF